MANNEQLKSMLVSLESLALKVRDCLSESHDQDTYANLLDEIKHSICNVEEITAALTEESSEVNVAEVYVNVSKARSWQIKLMDRIHFLESFSTNTNANANVNVNVVPKKKPGRLPEVKLNVFKGNFEEWETFWSLFRASVDVRDDLEKTTKFIYLVQSLEGEPKEMISGLAITDDNYPVALYILRDRYANKSKQTNVLMQKFHAMSTPKHNPKDLHVFLTEYRKIKHQLSRVLDFQASELVIKSVVVRKLPFQSFDKICDIYVTHDFTLEQMVTGIQHCDASRPKFLFKIKTSEGKLSSRPMFKPYEAIPAKKVASRPSRFKLAYVENSVDQCDAPRTSEELPVPTSSSPTSPTMPAVQVKQYSWRHNAISNKCFYDKRREFVNSGKHTNHASLILPQQAPLVSQVHLLSVVRKMERS